MLKAGIKNISVIVDGAEKTLLNEIDFQLEENKINVILGKNGTGKSTLIRALTRLLDDRFYKIAGKVLFNNTDLLSLSYGELLKVRKTKIRYVFQDAINSFDPLKTTGYFFRKYEGNPELDLLLQYFLLPDRKELFRLYPYEVSGGMAQRLLLVQALIARPDILILDEPTSGIDTPISNLILLKLREFIKEPGRSVLLVTQDLQFAKNAGDRIAYLAEGTLSQFYSINEFFENIPGTGLKNFISAYKQLI
jgi:ABC-type glutathione transport system ATPase component